MDKAQQENKEPTAEEIAEMEKQKKEMKAFFESEMDFLKVQRDYESLVTEIEELHMRRWICRQRMAQIKAGTPGNKLSQTSEAGEKQ